MMSVPNRQPQLNGNSLRIAFVLLLLLLLSACDEDNGNDDGNNSVPTPDAQLANIVELRVDVGRATAFNIPDRNGAEVFTLVEGDRIEAGGRSEPDALGTVFYVVRFGDRSGWIAETQVEVLRGDVETLLLVPSDAFALNVIEETEQAQARTPDNNDDLVFQVFAQAVVDDAVVYESPDLESAVLRTVSAGTQLEIIASTIPDAEGLIFYGIRLQPQGQGWVTNRMFEHIGDLTLRQQVVLESSVLTPTPTLAPAQATALAAMPSDTPIPPSSTPVIIGPTLPPEGANLTPTTTLTPFGGADIAGQAGDTDSLITATRTPDATATPLSSPTPLPTSTPRTIRPAEPPLLTIELPAGWQEGHVLLPLVSSIYLDTEIVLSVYEGPLSDGATGRISVLWRFPPLLPSSEELSLWPNAVLYLRSLLFSDCTHGIYESPNPAARERFPIGGIEAEGAWFSVVNCLDGSPDVRGWFVTLQAEGENYAFYMTVEPVEGSDRALTELQAITQSIRFIPTP